eukprot:1189655-Prorocentrum_minimum.AAC.2
MSAQNPSWPSINGTPSQPSPPPPPPPLSPLPPLLDTPEPGYPGVEPGYPGVEPGCPGVEPGCPGVTTRSTLPARRKCLDSRNPTKSVHLGSPAGGVQYSHSTRFSGVREKIGKKIEFSNLPGGPGRQHPRSLGGRAEISPGGFGGPSPGRLHRFPPDHVVAVVGARLLLNSWCNVRGVTPLATSRPARCGMLAWYGAPERHGHRAAHRIGRAPFRLARAHRVQRDWAAGPVDTR